MKRPWSIALPFGLAILLGAGTASATFTNLYIFGDSLSDSGNLFALTGGTLPPSPPYAGKMSNGPVAVEYLAANLGLPIAPAGIPLVPGYDLGGNNFALVGAATGMVPTRFVAGGPYDNYAAFSDNYPPAADALNGISGIDKQVLGFGIRNGFFADPNALYVVWGGPNDAYIALEDPPLVTQSRPFVMNAIAVEAATRAAGDIGTSVATLAVMGARHFLVPNIPDLSMTPDALFGPGMGLYGTQYAPALHQYSLTFNDLLDDAVLAALGAPVSALGIDIGFVDVFAEFEALLSDPSLVGQVPCILVDACVANAEVAESFVFWDTVHPTTAVHRRLGEIFTAAAIPEPATIALFVLGLTGLGAMRRHKTMS